MKYMFCAKNCITKLKSYSISSIVMEKVSLFFLKLTFHMLTVSGQQYTFSTHERMFLWNYQSFWDRKCLDLRVIRTPDLRIHAEYKNTLWYHTGAQTAYPRFTSTDVRTRQWLCIAIGQMAKKDLPLAWHFGMALSQLSSFMPNSCT